MNFVKTWRHSLEPLRANDVLCYYRYEVYAGRAMGPGLLFVTIWAGWVISWIIAARWSGRTEKTVATPQVWLYRVLIFFGAVLLWHDTGKRLGFQRLWHVGYDGAYILAGFTLGGILFAWYARIHIGRFWSSSITRKEGHHVVDSGPYGLVRHPIYTGMIGATFATMLVEATVTGIMGFILIAAGLYVKATIEERFLAQELGDGAYNDYRRRVPMLVPFLPVGRST